MNPYQQPYQNYYPQPGYMPGYQYPQQAPNQPLYNIYLTPEQINELSTNPESFNCKLTRTEYLESICQHKTPTHITLEKLPNGNHRCSICQQEFYLFEPNTADETIVDICENMANLLQSIKLYLLNSPADMKDVYLMLGFVKKIPLLWKSAVKSFEQASNVGGFGMPDQNTNSFALMGNIFGNGIIPGYEGYYQQPMTPPMAMYSQPGFAPQPTPGLPNSPVTPSPYQNQQYGFNANNMMVQGQGVPANGYQVPNAPPPPGYPNPASNPIGYVEPNQVATQTIQIGGNGNQSQPPQQPIAPPPPPVNNTSANPNVQPPPATPPAPTK